jgi:hypothetical protein
MPYLNFGGVDVNPDPGSSSYPSRISMAKKEYRQGDIASAG